MAEDANIARACDIMLTSRDPLLEITNHNPNTNREDTSDGCEEAVEQQPRCLDAPKLDQQLQDQAACEDDIVLGEAAADEGLLASSDREDGRKLAGDNEIQEGKHGDQFGTDIAPLGSSERPRRCK